MITDKLLRVSENQAITTTAVSTNTIDLGVARDIGEGTSLTMYFTVTAAMVGGTSINFEVVNDDNAALTSPAVIGASGAILTAGLTVGANIAVKLNPSIGTTGQRYVGARYTVVGTYSAGTVTADMVETIQDGKKYYASGFVL